MAGLGRALIIIGLLLTVLGLFFSLGGRIPWLGHLPGDIYIQRDRFTFYFPIVTCLLISIILTLIFYFLRK